MIELPAQAVAAGEPVEPIDHAHEHAFFAYGLPSVFRAGRGEHAMAAILGGDIPLIQVKHAIEHDPVYTFFLRLEAMIRENIFRFHQPAHAINILGALGRKRRNTGCEYGEKAEKVFPHVSFTKVAEKVSMQKIVKETTETGILALFLQRTLYIVRDMLKGLPGTLPLKRIH